MSVMKKEGCVYGEVFSVIVDMSEQNTHSDAQDPEIFSKYPFWAQEVTLDSGDK